MTNTRAERVKAVRALSGRSVRQRSGLFLAEGPQCVREAVRFASVRDVYATAAAAERYGAILDDAAARGMRVQLASDEVLAAMSADAQGLVAVVAQESPTLEAVLASGPALVAVLATVRDPGNAGTVIRAADAAGADAVVLTAESVDIFNPKTVRATAGSLFHLPVVTGEQLADAVAALRAAGLAVLAADGAGEHDLDDLLDVAGRAAVAADDPAAVTDAADAVPDLARATAWVFGNEAWGLAPADRELADAVVRVPLRGQAESLNLATAATVCLYASARAQR
ncbi:RNA methyltransferase [Pengzhenrongella sicca]|uniref:RNA methyltransferase n=1 Tax=Pengzhenrongella sicca TaxID=2819238 RepID=A0A8A4ZH60_9MICO|nr:RNA methyltransferase [Pengzhenrongella sicca]